MAKGYWIAQVDVKDEEAMKRYAAANPAIYKKFGGRYLVRANKFEVAEGTSRSRRVVVEFPDYASALACYRSPEYQANIKVRTPHAVVDFVIVEGYDGRSLNGVGQVFRAQWAIYRREIGRGRKYLSGSPKRIQQGLSRRPPCGPRRTASY